MPLKTLSSHAGAMEFRKATLNAAQSGYLTASDQVGKAGFRLKVFIVDGRTGMPLPIVEALHSQLHFVRRAMHPASFIVVIEQERIRPGFWLELVTIVEEKLAVIWRAAREIDPNANLLLSGLPDCWDVTSLRDEDILSGAKYESFRRNWKRLRGNHAATVSFPEIGNVPIELAATSACATFRPLFSVADRAAASFWNAALVMVPLSVAVNAGSPLLNGAPSGLAHTGQHLMQQAFHSVGGEDLFPPFHVGFVNDVKPFGSYEDKRAGFAKLLASHLDPEQRLLIDPRSDNGREAVHDALNLAMALLKVELGDEHLRIGPVLYSPGPTVRDMVADAWLFWAGVQVLMQYTRREIEMPSLTEVRRNIDQATRYGIDASLHWPGYDKPVKLGVILNSLHRTLFDERSFDVAGIRGQDAEKNFEVIHKRVQRCGVGALKLKWLKQGAAPAEITRLLARLTLIAEASNEWHYDWKWMAHVVRWIDQGAPPSTAMLQLHNQLEYDRTAPHFWPEKWVDTALGRSR